MYVCMYNNVWKFEQVLSKEPLVSVFSFSFSFSFFKKGASLVVQLTRKNHIGGYGLR